MTKSLEKNSQRKDPIQAIELDKNTALVITYQKNSNP